jgi:Na+-driven multidrug efflux pump
MGIVYSILVIFFMPLHGLNQGVQPIVGYNYGAKQYGRVKEAYRLATLSGTVFVCAGFALVQLFPSVCIALFRNEEGPLMDMGIRALRLSTICLPFLGFQVISASFFQAIGKALQGTILSLSRQILLYIPILFILPRFLGINGVFFAMPSADLGATILSALIIRAEFKKLKS